MNLRRLAGDLKNQLADSLLFESDEDFRAQMARLVKRSVGLLGVLGPIALIVFLVGQVFVLGKSPTFTYRGQVPQLITVLWDKLAMFAVFAALLATRPFLPDDRPAPARFVMALASVIVVVVITLDDVAIFNAGFTPAYVTMVILLLAAAVPMRPISLLVCTGLIVGAWYVSVTALPLLLGLPQPIISGEQVVFLTIISIISTGAGSLLYNVRHEEFLARKKAEDLSRELKNANRSLEKAIEDLRSAQDRLIHAEKMASLGRFAAGVAHELRNPLNFVSNFAELSVGLLDEAEEESGSVRPDSESLRENLERIRGHAARAEHIVKSLIAHSEQRRSGPTYVDLNRLVKEQASDIARRYGADPESATIDVDLKLDDRIGELEVLPAELTIALAGILDNAFLATLDRSRSEGDEYEPKIEIITAREADGVRIEIRDNGVGMSDDHAGKIFEPFYTTRPAGSGTGLGLAAAYAAITEGHGGSIDVHSQPGVGSIFTVRIRNATSDPPG